MADVTARGCEAGIPRERVGRLFPFRPLPKIVTSEDTVYRKRPFLPSLAFANRVRIVEDKEMIS